MSTYKEILWFLVVLSIRGGHAAAAERLVPLGGSQVRANVARLRLDDRGDELAKVTYTEKVRAALAAGETALDPAFQEAAREGDASRAADAALAHAPVVGDARSGREHWIEGHYGSAFLSAVSATADAVGIRRFFRGAGVAKVPKPAAVEQGIKTLEEQVAKEIVIEGAEASTNVFKHNFKYDHRVRMRATQDPVSHNFPYSFDDAILATTPILKKNGYQMFQLKGTMNAKKGVFGIGLTKEGVIDHRFFRPFNKPQ